MTPNLRSGFPRGKQPSDSSLDPLDRGLCPFFAASNASHAAGPFHGSPVHRGDGDTVVVQDHLGVQGHFGHTGSGHVSALRQPLGLLLEGRGDNEKRREGFFTSLRDSDGHNPCERDFPWDCLFFQSHHQLGSGFWVLATSAPRHEAQPSVKELYLPASKTASEISFNSSRCLSAAGIFFFCNISVTGTSPMFCVKPLFLTILFWSLISSLAPGAPAHLRRYSPALISEGPFPPLRCCVPPQGSLCFLLSLLSWGHSQVRLPCTWGSHAVSCTKEKSPQTPMSETCFPFPCVLPWSFSMWLLCCLISFSSVFPLDRETHNCLLLDASFPEACKYLIILEMILFQ